MVDCPPGCTCDTCVALREANAEADALEKLTPEQATIRALEARVAELETANHRMGMRLGAARRALENYNWVEGPDELKAILLNPFWPGPGP